MCDSLLQRGDSVHAAFDNQTALKVYRSAYRRCPDRYEPLMKMTRAYNDVGEDTGVLDPFESAMRYADTLQQRYPDSMQGYFLKAAAAGNLAQTGGPRHTVKMSRVVERNARAAIERDSTYAPAHVILGAYYSRVANANTVLKRLANWFLGGIPEGTNEDALRHLRKAAALDSNNVYAQLELGKTYLALGNKDKARHHLKRVQQIPISDHSHPRLRKEAKELLEGL